MSLDHDKISTMGKRYQRGLCDTFDVVDEAAPLKIRTKYEEAMHAYIEDPVTPIRKRYELFKKCVNKKCADEMDRANAGYYTRIIEQQLDLIVSSRKILIEIAERSKIKFKKGIIV